MTSKFLSANLKDLQVIAQQTRQLQNDIKSALGNNLVFKEDTVIEQQTQSNTYFLGAGNRQGFTLGNEDGELRLAPGCRVLTQVTINGSAVIHGGTFVCVGDDSAIVIGDAAKVILVGARIEKELNKQSGGGSYISVASGGILSVVGCHFKNAQSGGKAIINAGAAGDCLATGTIDGTGQGHTNVTVGVEVTV